MIFQLEGVNGRVSNISVAPHLPEYADRAKASAARRLSINTRNAGGTWRCPG
jgi:hypothetical protein